MRFWLQITGSANQNRIYAPHSLRCLMRIRRSRFRAKHDETLADRAEDALLRRETEWAALGVAADCPALARVDDGPFELDDALECPREIRDAEVRQREAITGAAATVVQPERRALVVGLQALTFPRPPLV
jgi:hypothetical protein